MRVNQKIPPPKKILLHSKSSKHKNGKLFLCFDHTGQLKYQVRTQNSVVMANLSKKSLMIRKKWQQEAVKRGGKDAKIIYSSTEALPVIFALLRDVFAPLNITSIYEMLKAVIPPPLLKSCLDAMTAETDAEASEGEEDDAFVSKKTSKSGQKNSSFIVSQEYRMTVSVKLGRNGNTTLYYLNQGKLDNEGNGLDSAKRQELMGAKQCALKALSQSQNEYKLLQQETVKISSEPKNKELDLILIEEENGLKNIKDQLKISQEFKENVSRRLNLKRNVDMMASQWVQRKRKCLDFLDMMEENTEGAVSKKKCLSGKGQLEVESDEACLEEAKKFHSRMSLKKNSLMKGHGYVVDKFVGVLIGPKATIVRVFMD